MCPLLPVLSQREIKQPGWVTDTSETPPIPHSQAKVTFQSVFRWWEQHTHVEYILSFSLPLILPLPITVNQAQSIREKGAKQAWTQRSSKQLGVQITMVNKIHFQPPHHYTPWPQVHCAFTPSINHSTAISHLPAITLLHIHMTKPHHCTFTPPNQHSITPLHAQIITSLPNHHTSAPSHGHITTSLQFPISQLLNQYNSVRALHHTHCKSLYPI